jgi:primosomal protein N' (replication factor Y)
VCSSEEPGRELAAAEAIRERIDGVPVLGPASLFRLKGRERAQLVVKATDRGSAVRTVRQAVEAEHARNGVNFAVDVDPQ